MNAFLQKPDGESEEGDEHKHYDEAEVLHELKHFLPAQAPLKDFVHHNTLHAFQDLKFYRGLHNASEIFGYKVSLTLDEYRKLFDENKIREDILEYVICKRFGKENLYEWKLNALSKPYDTVINPRIGQVRSVWKTHFHSDLDSYVHPKLFRLLCNYLDQGITIWSFPIRGKGFLEAMREMEKHSKVGFFNTPRARAMLLNENTNIAEVLNILVGDESLYKHYLFDQQFAHQGWSGMISSLETFPENLLDGKKITLHDLILFECLCEIDALDFQFGEIWSPIAFKMKQRPGVLFRDVVENELSEVFTIWQEAFEWSYYDEVLAAIQQGTAEEKTKGDKKFQAMFCIDDRECSLRRYLEAVEPDCETFGTPGFFSVEFYFQPENGKFYTKLCPAPVTPKYLIKEKGSHAIRSKDYFHSRSSHSLVRGALITQTLGFWSAFKLFLNIFKPTMSPATAYSFNHMDKFSKLTIENTNPNDKENDLQIGFNVEEMTNRIESLLKSIGMVTNFAPIVYIIGHGSSSVNNPHYAGYDCGACSGRPGSVNARVASDMANKKEVREALKQRGITIPETTQFLGGLHDTSRDEFGFYDEDVLSVSNTALHKKNAAVFSKALDSNAKERSRRLVSIDTGLSAEKIHEQIKTRSVSIFEPRPELNHATNALCIVGGRDFTKGLFLDRRSFMNSYDYKIDPDGKILTNIMKPLGPVCGGINLEYFFSRVDNQKLGAGTKLPHNVMGLFGVANGIDGDLRPGLPSQMIEIHDPVRLLIIVEHFPEVVLNVIKSLDAMYEWYINDWINLIAVNPETHQLFLFKDGRFVEYEPVQQVIETVSDITPVLESTMENIPVYIIK